MALSHRDKKGTTALKFTDQEIHRHLETIAFQKGIDTENFVERAILFLKSQGHVLWYYRAHRWGEADMLGMDFVIVFSNYEPRLLQVKSSEFRKAEHLAKYGDKIPCVVRYPLDTVEIMAGKILMETFPEFFTGDEHDVSEYIGNTDETSTEESNVEPLTVSLEEIFSNIV